MWTALSHGLVGPDAARKATGKKMAGLECGPAKKKVQTFRGEHRPVEWEETTERFYLCERICVLWRRILFQRSAKMAKFMLSFVAMRSGAHRPGLQQVRIMAARHVGM